VLAGRDRHLRQEIRQSRLTTLWVIEDWEFSWTVELDRSYVRFERRPANDPDATLAWRTAAEFFRQVEAGSLSPEEVTHEGAPMPRRTLDCVCQCFCDSLRAVMANPVDENGDPLL